MILDLGLLAALLVFAYSGWRSGAIRQLTHWGGLACGLVASGPAAARLTPYVVPHVGVPAAITRVLLSSIMFPIFGGLGAWAIHAILDKLSGGRELGRADLAGGAVFGLLKGGALGFIALSVLVFFEQPLVKYFGPPPPAVADSYSLSFIRRHGLFESAPVPAVAKLEKLLAAVRDPKAAKALSRDPEFRAMLTDPALRKTLNDDGVATALLTGDLDALKKDPRLAALLKDPRLSGRAP